MEIGGWELGFGLRDGGFRASAAQLVFPQVLGSVAGFLVWDLTSLSHKPRQGLVAFLCCNIAFKVICSHASGRHGESKPGRQDALRTPYRLRMASALLDGFNKRTAGEDLGSVSCIVHLFRWGLCGET